MFVDATFRSGDMRCRVRKTRKKWLFFVPQISEEAPNFFFGGGGAFVHLLIDITSDLLAKFG